MNRVEFMKELEYLLSDISEEDKKDAISYYSDYLEEAGPDNEEQVIREFGSPERIASIIRSDLSGNLEDGGEFTETGYQDQRFKNPGYEMAERFDLPEVREFGKSGEKQTFTEDKAGEGQSVDGSKKETKRNTAKTVAWILLIIAAAPVLLSIGGGIVGVISGVFGMVLTALLLVGGVTFGLLAGGIGLVVGGICFLLVDVMTGSLLLGCGLFLFGTGLLGIAFCAVFYGKFVPWLLRSCVNLAGSLIHGRGQKR
ncbi:MAG TPA: DUF1700 domain-containing protein [Candidatus Hungatella pullicola]|nr:DUF1700 domain-containing protein [Candidatus Hungatella pullicola]